MKAWVMCCIILLAACNVVSPEESEVVETAVLPPTTAPQTPPTESPAATLTLPSPTAAPIPLITYYYLLSEQAAEIIEVNSDQPRQMRRFQLPSDPIGAERPEGITYVSNDEVTTHGLLGLDASSQGGYFLVSTQEDGMIYVVELPLQEDDSIAVIATSFTIPSLDEDASGLAYQNGLLWVAMAKKERLYAVTLDDDVVVEEQYDLKELPFDAEDTEGIIFPSAGWEADAIFLADDKGRSLRLYTDFPACIEAERCEDDWSFDVDPLEASGLAWDEQRQQLVVVGDEGQLMRFDVDADSYELVLQLADDLEGVAVVVR